MIRDIATGGFTLTEHDITKQQQQHSGRRKFWQTLATKQQKTWNSRPYSDFNLNIIFSGPNCCRKLTHVQTSKIRFGSSPPPPAQLIRSRRRLNRSVFLSIKNKFWLNLVVQVLFKVFTSFDFSSYYFLCSFCVTYYFEIFFFDSGPLCVCMCRLRLRRYDFSSSHFFTTFF